MNDPPTPRSPPLVIIIIVNPSATNADNTFDFKCSYNEMLLIANIARRKKIKERRDVYISVLIPPLSRFILHT